MSSEMTHNQPLARRIIQEALNRGANDIVGLAGHLFGKVPSGAEYFAARLAVSALMAERLIDATQTASGGVVYHITSKTPIEPRKDK
jgi:hypothetical protein